MTAQRVAIVCLGRPTALGEARRVESWLAILRQIGAETSVVRLLDLGSGWRRWPVTVGAVAAGRAMPESLAWDVAAADRAVAHADVAICVTGRAYHPGLSVPVVLDLVDQLAVSYRDRARIGGFRQLPFRILAAAAARFEGRANGPPRVAAGWTDAEALDARWVPNVVASFDGVQGSRRAPDVDVVFFGNLSYPPNVAAIDELRRAWPSVERARSGTTLLLAGRGGEHLRRERLPEGWLLGGPFESPEVVCRRARVAVAPLRHASGIQNKVLEAAAAGVPQVLSTPALAGLRPGFPGEVADSPQSVAHAIVRLLDDVELARDLAARARTEIETTYTPAAWAGTVRELLDLAQ